MDKLKMLWLCTTLPFFLLGMAQYLFFIGIGPRPKVYIYLWFISSMLLFFSNAGIKRLLRHRVVLWMAVFLVISLIRVPMIWNEFVFEELVHIILNFILVITSCIVLAHVSAATMRKILWVSLLLGAGSVVYEMVFPVAVLEEAVEIHDSSGVNIFGRAAGFYLNPNNAGIGILLIGMCLVLLDSKRGALFAMIVAFPPIIFTFSRGALAGWLIAMLAFSMSDRLPRGTAFGLLVFLVFFHLTGESIVSYLNNVLESDDVNDWTNSLDRLQFFVSGSADDHSADSRMQVARWALAEIFQSPYVGGGLGYSQEWTVTNPDSVNTHNLYLKHALDFGLIGFLLFPLLLYAAIFTNKGDTASDSLAVILVIFFLGFTSHNLLEQSFFVIPMCIFHQYFFDWHYRERENGNQFFSDVNI